MGHLITKFRPGPRYTPNGPDIPGEISKQDEAWIENPLLVHDYARGGDDVQGVKRQIERAFLPGLGRNTELKWTAEEALFGEFSFCNMHSEFVIRYPCLTRSLPYCSVTWVGINDCAYAKKNLLPTTLYDAHHGQQMCSKLG